MTETSPTRSGHVSSPSYATSGSNDVSGWVVFAGIVLIMLGAFQVIEGLVALFDEGHYLGAPSGLVLSVDYNTWDWVHLIIEILAIATGARIIAGNMVARVVCIALAGDRRPRTRADELCRRTAIGILAGGWAPRRRSADLTRRMDRRTMRTACSAT